MILHIFRSSHRLNRIATPFHAMAPKTIHSFRFACHDSDCAKWIAYEIEYYDWQRMNKILNAQHLPRDVIFLFSTVMCGEITISPFFLVGAGISSFEFSNEIPDYVWISITFILFETLTHGLTIYIRLFTFLICSLLRCFLLFQPRGIRDCRRIEKKRL